MPLRISHALSTAALAPEITVCLGSLKLAADTTAPVSAAARAQPSHHGCGLQPEDGRHRAGAHRHRLLHRLRAKAHQRQRIGQRQRAGGHQRGVFAQRVAGQRRRLRRRPRRARRGSRRWRRPASPAACWWSARAPGQGLRESGGRRPRPAPARSRPAPRARRGGRPRRRACRRSARPAPERRMQTPSCANRSVSEIEQHGAPGEAAAHAFEQHGVAALDAAVLARPRRAPAGSTLPTCCRATRRWPPACRAPASACAPCPA